MRYHETNGPLSALHRAELSALVTEVGPAEVATKAGVTNYVIGRALSGADLQSGSRTLIELTLVRERGNRVQLPGAVRLALAAAAERSTREALFEAVVGDELAPVAFSELAFAIVGWPVLPGTLEAVRAWYARVQAERAASKGQHARGAGR